MSSQCLHGGKTESREQPDKEHKSADVQNSTHKNVR